VPPTGIIGVFAPKTEEGTPFAGTLLPGLPPISDIKSGIRPAIHLRGIAIQDCIPIGPRRDLPALVNALTSRMLKIVPEPQENCYQYILDNMDNPDSVCSLFVTKTHDLTLPFTYEGRKWPSYHEYWLSRFPLGVRNQLVRAKEAISSRGIRKGDVTYSAFMKTEKFTTLTQTGITPVDSRVVLSNTPVSNWILGPQTHSRSKQLYTSFPIFDSHGNPSVIAWATHCTGNDIGRWFQATQEIFPDCIWICGDQSRCERHFNTEALALQIEMRKRSGWPQPLLEFYQVHLTDPEFRGQGNDLYGKSDKPIIPSGVQGTSQDNFTTTICNTISGLGEPSRSTYMIIGMGDDVVIACQRGFASFDDDQCPSIRRMHLKCGYEITGFDTDKPWMIDFLSNWVVPSTRGWVLTPRIGRFISRCGFTVNPLRFDVHSTAQGYVNAVSHCPFLSHYVAKTLAVTKRAHKGVEKRYITYEQGAEPTDDTWMFLAGRYGLDKMDLNNFLDRLDLVKTAPAVLEWPAFHHVLTVDNILE